MSRLIFIMFVSLVTVTGCDVNEAPPASLIDNIPVITIGQGKPPEEGDYILFVPGDKPVPVALSVTGSFLAKSTSIDTQIQVQQDLYIFKQWSSFDGRDWHPSADLFDTRMRAGLTPDGAKVNVQFNRATPAQQ